MTDLIISIIELIGGFAKQVFPKTDYMSQVTVNLETGISSLIKWLQMVNFILPLNDIFKMITFIIVITLGGFLLFVLNWIIRRVFDVIP